jgi:hypothetical protein
VPVARRVGVVRRVVHAEGLHHVVLELQREVLVVVGWGLGLRGSTCCWAVGPAVERQVCI